MKTKPHRWKAKYNIKECLVTFIFRYRPLGTSLRNFLLLPQMIELPSIDVLRANDIAPRISDADLVVPSQDNWPSTSNHASRGKRKATDLNEVQITVEGFKDRENALLVSYHKHLPQITHLFLRLSLIDSKMKKSDFFWCVL